MKRLTLSRIALLVMTVAIFLAIELSVNAQSAREQLDQWVTQLRTNPGDNALRERIIKLAQEIKPAPAVPEEARRPLVQGNSAFQDAKSPEDIARAIDLYRSASNIAPWWPDAYFNLAKALEQRQKYPDAIAALKLYLLSASSSPDVREAQDKIYALEEKAERLAKAAADQAAAAQQAAAALARRKQWASTLSGQLNAMFAGKVMRTHYECSLDPNQFTGCTLAEYRGSNWYTFYPVYPRGILFEISPDGEKVHFRVGYDNGPQHGGSGYFNPNVGTPSGYDINSISWKDNDGKHKTIQFWKNNNGQPVYEISDAPVAQEAPGFDPSGRYRYSKHIGE